MLLMEIYKIEKELSFIIESFMGSAKALNFAEKILKPTSDIGRSAKRAMEKNHLNFFRVYRELTQDILSFLDEYEVMNPSFDIGPLKAQPELITFAIMDRFLTDLEKSR